MIITCLFCSLCFYEKFRYPFESNLGTLAPFIICFPLNIFISASLKCCRPFFRKPFIFPILFLLGNSSIMFIYFYLCILTQTEIILSLLLLQIAGALGRLVYIISNKVCYNIFELYFYSLLFLLAFEPIIFLIWTDNLFAIIFMFIGVALFNIFYVYEIYETLELLDIDFTFDDYYLCALIHFLGPFNLIIIISMQKTSDDD